MLRIFVIAGLVAACTHKYSTFGGSKTAPKSVLESSPAAQYERLHARSSNAQRTEMSFEGADLSGELSQPPPSPDIAVRHRRLLVKTPISWNDILVVSRKGPMSLFAGSSPTPPPVAQPLASAAPKEPEKLVIEAWFEIELENVTNGAAAIRARVESAGGRVVSENIVGSASAASSAALELRVPPAQASGVTEWLTQLGTVESKRVLASDVSKMLVDQELELKNLEVTMARLQKLAEASGPVTDLLAIEKEMTRVRGDIERVKGDQRWLIDRVDFATITVTLTREGGDDVELSPHARIFPGPHLAMLSLLTPGTRPRTRVGGGVTVHVNRLLTFDLGVFPQQDGDSRAVIATAGTALYSGYLGFGRRRFLNPYVGARVGYGYLSEVSGLIVAGELGVEWFKHRYLLVESAVRAVGFVLEAGNEAALHATLGFAVPF